MTIMAPKNKWELSDMLKFAVKFGSPIAIRYPRGLAYDGLEEYRKPVILGQSEMIFEESGIALLAVGSMVKVAEKVRDVLKNEHGKHVTLVNARFVKPIDGEMITYLAKQHDLIVTMEENVESGGFGEHVRAYMSDNRIEDADILVCALPDDYVEHGNVNILAHEVGIDCESIVEKIIGRYERKA
jgi:1-deoxy-D-xylulose-5-phosphate synthase